MTNILQEIKSLGTVQVHKKTRVRLDEIQRYILLKTGKKISFSQIAEDSSIKYFESVRRKYK